MGPCRVGKNVSWVSSLLKDDAAPHGGGVVVDLNFSTRGQTPIKDWGLQRGYFAVSLMALDMQLDEAGRFNNNQVKLRTICGQKP